MLVGTRFAISVIRKNIRREMEGHLKSDASMSRLVLKNRLQEIENLASLTSADNTLKVTLDLGIVPQLEEHLREIVRVNKLDFYKITDDRGLCVSCSPTIGTSSSFLKKQIGVALQGELTTGLSFVNYESGSKESSFAAPIDHVGKELIMVAVAPIWLRKQVVGTLSLGRLINNDTEIINVMKENIEANIIIWQKTKGAIASSLPIDGLAKFFASLNQLLDETMLKKSDKEKMPTADLLVDQKDFLVTVYPVKDFEDETVAFITLCKDIEALKALEKQTIKSMIIISLSGVCLAILFTSLITRFISKPIKKTVRAMVAVTEKNDLTQRVDMRAKGEVGKLVSAFNNMVDNIRESRARLQEFADTLDQKVRERTRELEQAQKELINKAMEAGRAQLSAMVLHNIGNAITPVKVQMEGMKTSELEQISHYLEKCYVDLNEHAQELQHYVNDDPRGKEAFSYLGKLIDSLKEHDKQKRDTANKIDGAVSYISEILTLQQAYAASEQETKEKTDLNSLIEDAIQMQTGALEKRRITVKKGLDPNMPKVLIDKNRLMQVIVNFIKNGYEAIDELNDDNKERVMAFKSFADDGHVGFEITDSGIGIEPEDINTIVEFGKSNKGSSGFGLYYCNMFVKNNRGALNISSPGKGKGATVSVRFQAANQ